MSDKIRLTFFRLPLEVGVVAEQVLKVGGASVCLNLAPETYKAAAGDTHRSCFLPPSPEPPALLMRLFACLFTLCHVIGTLLAYDIQDFEAIRQSAVRNIVSLENILEHRLAGAHSSRAHHKAHKSRRIGGNIVMGKR